MPVLFLFLGGYRSKAIAETQAIADIGHKKTKAGIKT